MENTAKQEVIKKAYGEHWENFKNMVDENGNVDDKKYSFLDAEDLFPIYREPLYGFNGEIVGVEKWRPYSIIDIDDNNGWRSIELDGLPESDDKLYIVGKLSGKKWYEYKGRIEGWGVKSESKISKVTHYRAVENYLKPIF